jgi:hypothetical protein
MANANHQHDEKVPAPRRNPPWPAIGAAAGAVAAVVAVLTFIVANSGGPGPAKASVRLVPVDRPTTVPLSVSALPAPPSYPSNDKENHCAQWRAWFERIGAEQAGPLVQVSAPRSAPVSLVGVRTTVYRAYTPQAKTQVDCTLGAGPLGGTYLERNLDRPVVPSLLATQFGAHKLAMPPAVFRVGAGGSEDLAIQPAGRPGRFYDWRLTLDLVVDQRSQRFTFGSRAHPLRSYVPRAPQADNIPSVDYNFGTRSWGKAF